MKESPGGIKFSLEGMEDDLQDEVCLSYTGQFQVLPNVSNF